MSEPHQKLKITIWPYCGEKIEPHNTLRNDFSRHAKPKPRKTYMSKLLLKVNWFLCATLFWMVITFV